MTGLVLTHAPGRLVGVRTTDDPACPQGVEIVRYVYASSAPQVESPRPFAHPLRTRHGAVVTVDRPHDHRWHRGLAWSWPCVGDENFWGGPTYLRGRGYVQLDNDGAMNHVQLHRADCDGEVAVLAHALRWTTRAGAEIVHDERHLTVRLVPEGWVLTTSTHLTNLTEAPLTFGSPTTRGRDDAGYGGLLWRGPRSFTGGTVVAGPAAGSAAGTASDAGPTTGGDDLRGGRAPWMAFVGRHDGVGRGDPLASSTVVVVDDPHGTTHPPQWFARSQGFACLNPAPFFSTEFDLPPGGSLSLRHAVAVADGDDAGLAPVLAQHGLTALHEALAERSAAAAR